MANKISARAARFCLALSLCSLSSANRSAQAQSSSVPPATIEPQTFTYSTVGTQQLKAYVFLPPAGVKSTGKARPAILLFHGGAWQLGDAS